MPIKNSLKIFASKFSMVYSILLYLVIATVVLASVSVFALIPVYRFLEAEGVTAKAGDVITKLVINGYSSELFDQVVECLERIAEVMRARSDLVVLTVLYAVYRIVLPACLRYARPSDAEKNKRGDERQCRLWFYRIVCLVLR